MYGIQEYQIVLRRKKRKILHSDKIRYGPVQLNDRGNFQINIFNVYLNNLLRELFKNMSAYAIINRKFVVIIDLKI